MYTYSSKCISEAISTNYSTIDNETAGDMRREYLSIVDKKNWSFKQKKNKLYSNIVEPVYETLDLKPTSNNFQIEVVNKRANTAKTIHINNSNMVTIGRWRENDVYLSDDKRISRLQGYMFVAGNKIVFCDVWSFMGTVTVQRSDKWGECLSTLPKKRNILMFNKYEIIYLQISQCIDVLIIPQDANKTLLKSFPIFQYRQKIAADDEKMNDKIDDEKKMNLSEKQQEFKEWLCDDMDLSEYYDVFIENGFDDIKVVKLLKENDLKELGIDKKGSRLKIMLYSKKSEQQNNNEQVEGDIDTNQDTTEDIEELMM